jgi:hypothetical protein
MRALVFTILLVSSNLLALVIGDRSARRIGAVLTIAALSTWLLPLTIDQRFAHISWGLFAIDAATWVALLGVTACSDKHWPSWIAGMQGVTVISHLARLAPHINIMVYFWGTVSWAWPMQTILLIAALNDWPLVRRRLSSWLLR